MIKAILFDMDGVLYDSMPSHAQAWYETMLDIGITTSPEDFYLLEGRTGRSTINLFFHKVFDRDASPEEQESIYAKKSQRFVELEGSGSKPMQGALSALQKVRQSGLRIVLVTGSGQLSLLEKLAIHFPGFFEEDRIVTAYDVQFGKPHPEPYLIGLQKAGVRASEAIAVENAPLGVESAVAAGIHTIAVNTGPLSDLVLLDAGASSVYPSMQFFADDVENLIRKS